MSSMKPLPKRQNVHFLVCALFLTGCLFFGCQNQVVETTHGVIVKVHTPKGDSCLKARKVRLEVVNDHIIHDNATAKSRFSDKKSLMASFKYPSEKSWAVEKSDNGSTVLSTSALRAIVSADGTVSFTDIDGHPILSEKSRTFLPMTDPQADKRGNHKKAFTIRQMWKSGEDEAYYGLGQHQADEFNYKNKNEQLFQYNTKISVPFVVSSRGYGILWDNTSLSRWGDARDYSKLNSLFKIYDKEGKEGGLTGTYSNSRAETLVRKEPFLCFENQLYPNY